MDEQSVLKATLDQTPVLVFRMDKQGQLISIVGAEVQKLGLDKVKIGQSQFKNPNLPCKRSYFKRALAGGNFSATFNINGTIYETFFTPIYDSDKTINGVIGLSIDVL